MVRVLGVMFLISIFCVSCGKPVKRQTKGLVLQENELVLGSETIDIPPEEGGKGCEYKGKYYYVGDSFKAKCNSCACMSDGRVVCTQMACKDNPKKKKKYCKLGKKKYKVGQSFKRKCNMCACTKKGIVCTQMGCVDDPIAPIKKVCVYKNKKYKLGETLKIKCNTCSCTEAGMVCTKMGCIDEDLPKPCGRGYEGTSCVPPKDEKPIPPIAKVCKYAGEFYNIGDSFKSEDGCNMCSCISSGVICTQRACGDMPIFN